MTSTKPRCNACRTEVLTALRQRALGDVLTLEGEHVEHVVMNLRFSGPKVLEEIEVSAALFVERHDLAVQDGVVRQELERGGDVGELGIQEIAAPRVEQRLSV